MSAGWQPVNRQHPCPICGKPDWCGRTEDGAVVRCMRAQGIPVPSGWLLVKTDPDGGTVFRRQDDLDRRLPTVEPTREQAPETHDTDWAKRAANRAKEITPDQLTKLAVELSVTPASLKAIGIGWSGRLKAYTVPEHDGSGQVVGIATRTLDGRKGFMKGGKRGLTIPTGLKGLSDPVLLVEGHSDVAAGLSQGLAAVGRPSNVGGVDQLTQLLDGREVIVVGEFDPKSNGSWPGRDGAQKVAAQLAKRWEKPVPWALPPNSTKDIRWWLNARGLDLCDDEERLEAGRGLLEVLKQQAVAAEPPVGADNGHPYEEAEHGLVYLRRTKDGDVPVHLTNFHARIVADVTRDDGQEETHSFEIEAKICAPSAQSRRLTVPASRFPGLSWVGEQLGARAIVQPGTMTKDRARTAIQELSGEIALRHVYTHTGWRYLPGHGWVYLHRGGALGAHGNVPDVQVDLQRPLDLFLLPNPPSGADLAATVRASLDLLHLAPALVMFPLLGMLWRSVLGPADFSGHLAGKTSVFKSELAALVQQHSGSGYDARHLPGSWSSTANSLETTSFLFKDAIFVVDDFAPHGSPADVARSHRDADRLHRAQGNRSARGRLRSDGELRAPKAPRGLILSTGEDIPRGHSLRARLMVIEIKEGDIDVGRLTEAQQAARQGRFAQTLAGYIAWLAPQYEQLRQQIPEEVARIREKLPLAGAHRRIPVTTAHLVLGWRLFLNFAREVGTLTQVEYDELSARYVPALSAAADLQETGEEDPARRFPELIASAIASGRAHVAEPSGSHPTNDPTRWGWREHHVGRDATPEWQAQGVRIGWVVGEDLYLDPAAAYNAAAGMLESGMTLGVSERRLRKSLCEAGLLASTDDARGKITVRRVLQGSRRSVLHFKVNVLEGGVPPEPAHASHSAHAFPQAVENGDRGPVPWAAIGGSALEPAPENGPCETDQGGNGPDGPNGPGMETSPAMTTESGEEPPAVPDDREVLTL